jgi:hypothetical protein
MHDAAPATVLDRPVAPALLQVDGIAKRYGDETALADVAFAVHPFAGPDHRCDGRRVRL